MRRPRSRDTADATVRRHDRHAPISCRSSADGAPRCASPRVGEFASGWTADGWRHVRLLTGNRIRLRSRNRSRHGDWRRARTWLRTWHRRRDRQRSLSRRWQRQLTARARACRSTLHERRARATDSGRSLAAVGRHPIRRAYERSRRTDIGCRPGRRSRQRCAGLAFRAWDAGGHTRRCRGRRDHEFPNLLEAA